MISKDDQVLDAIIGELVNNRDVSVCAPRGSPAKTILLFGEWDTEYGRRADQALQGSLEKAKSLHCSADSVSPRVSFYTFVTGLDGVTIPERGGTVTLKGRVPVRRHRVLPRNKLNGRKARISRTTSDVWDRVRYSPDRNRKSRSQWVSSPAILTISCCSCRHSAIGFPLHPLFTTDLDARFVHPMVRKWTRNLIVGSSFGLQLRQEIQARTPPFRDVYQTATYLGTLVAMQLPVDGPGQSKLYELSRNWLQEPLLYEIDARGRCRRYRGSSTTQPMPLLVRPAPWKDAPGFSRRIGRRRWRRISLGAGCCSWPLASRWSCGSAGRRSSKPLPVAAVTRGASWGRWASRAGEPTGGRGPAGAAEPTAARFVTAPRDVFGLYFRAYFCAD